MDRIHKPVLLRLNSIMSDREIALRSAMANYVVVGDDFVVIYPAHYCACLSRAPMLLLRLYHVLPGLSSSDKHFVPCNRSYSNRAAKRSGGACEHRGSGRCEHCHAYIFCLIIERKEKKNITG
jgi:hypothetical protein